MKVLVFVDFFLPGFKSGGPLRTLVGMHKNLGHLIDFRIVTRGHDVAERRDYPGIRFGEWNIIEGINVFYCRRGFEGFIDIIKVLRVKDYKIIYLNSFFSLKFSAYVLASAKLIVRNKANILLAPRGEFSPGAFEKKAFKKRLFKYFLLKAGFLRNVSFQASSNMEKRDIRANLKVLRENIYVAPDLFYYENSERMNQSKEISNKKGISVVFISRIVPKKNLHFLLEVMLRLKVSINFDIYGPIEDQDYWKVCENLIKQVPGNINIRYCGEVFPTDILNVFSKYDLFAFPTLGENFGHVILESLVAGTPVLLSPETPWLPTERQGVNICNLNIEDWVVFIDKYVRLDENHRLNMRADAYKFAQDYIDNNIGLSENMNMFQTLVN